MRRRSTASYKKELWKWFTLYVKKRDNWVCVTCGRKVEGQNAQGGHYIAKAACGLDYYFSEINVGTQCARCNLYLEGNRPAFRAYILAKHGANALADLEQHHHRPNKWTQTDFQEKIAHYKSLVQ